MLGWYYIEQSYKSKQKPNPTRIYHQHGHASATGLLGSWTRRRLMFNMKDFLGLRNWIVWDFLFILVWNFRGYPPSEKCSVQWLHNTQIFIQCRMLLPKPQLNHKKLDSSTIYKHFREVRECLLCLCRGWGSEYEKNRLKCTHTWDYILSRRNSDVYMPTM